MGAEQATVGKANMRGGAAPIGWATFMWWLLVDRLGVLDADLGGQMVSGLAAFLLVAVLRRLERRWPAFGWGLLAAGGPLGYAPPGEHAAPPPGPDLPSPGPDLPSWELIDGHTDEDLAP